MSFVYFFTHLSQYNSAHVEHNVNGYYNLVSLFIHPQYYCKISEDLESLDPDLEALEPDLEALEPDLEALEPEVA